eukprot:247048-Prymnesium_polylepis.1
MREEWPGDAGRPIVCGGVAPVDVENEPASAHNIGMKEECATSAPAPADGAAASDCAKSAPAPADGAAASVLTSAAASGAASEASRDPPYAVGERVEDDFGADGLFGGVVTCWVAKGD